MMCLCLQRVVIDEIARYYIFWITGCAKCITTVVEIVALMRFLLSSRKKKNKKKTVCLKRHIAFPSCLTISAVVLFSFIVLLCFSLYPIFARCLFHAGKCQPRLIWYVTFLQQYIPDAICDALVSRTSKEIYINILTWVCVCVFTLYILFWLIW